MRSAGCRCRRERAKPPKRRTRPIFDALRLHPVTGATAGQVGAELSGVWQSSVSLLVRTMHYRSLFNKYYDGRMLADVVATRDSP